MKRVPVVAMSKPLVMGIPPVVSDTYESFTGNITIPKLLHADQKYFAIEVLPSRLIDAEENWVLAGNDDVVTAILLSSLFPIWVRGITGKDEAKVNFKNSYNTFPFPSITRKQESELLERVSAIYKARGMASGKQLSDLYCSGDIPEHLEMAHEDLDEVVLKIFNLPKDSSNQQILDRLFEEYLKLYQG